jgi:hypothetical protein
MEKYQVIPGPKIREVPIVGGEGKTYKSATGKKLVRFGNLPSLGKSGFIIGEATTHELSSSPGDYEGRPT